MGAWPFRERVLGISATLAILSMTSAPVAAQTLAPGQVITPTLTFTPADLGTLLTQREEFGSENFSGIRLDYTARSAVYRNSGGTLDFVYQLSNRSTSNNGIGRFTNAIYPFETQTQIFFSVADVDGAGGVFTAGTEVPDLVDRGTSGTPIGFNFLATAGGRLQAGETSAVMLVRTDAVDYREGTFSVINGIASTVRGYAPAVQDGGTGNNPIPEPGAIALLCCPAALGFVGIVRRRRRSRTH